MDNVRLSIEGPVAIVLLDDAEHRNILTPKMVAGIAAAFDQAESDDRIRGIVLAASGRAFCAGAELDTLLKAADGDFSLVEAVYEGFLRVLRSPLLTVGAIGGPAVGAGMNLALACDIRLAGPQATFDSRFAELRLHPGGGHMYMLQRAVGYQQAAAACLLSQVICAEKAQRIGLVLDVVEGDLVAEAVELAARFGNVGAPLARRMIATFRESARPITHDVALALETTAQQWSTTLPEFVSGVEAIKRRTAPAQSGQAGTVLPFAKG